MTSTAIVWATGTNRHSTIIGYETDCIANIVSVEPPKGLYVEPVVCYVFKTQKHIFEAKHIRCITNRYAVPSCGEYRLFLPENVYILKYTQESALG